MTVAFQRDVQGLDYECLVGEHIRSKGDVGINGERTVHKPLCKGCLVGIRLIHIFRFVNSTEIEEFLRAVDTV